MSSGSKIEQIPWDVRKYTFLYKDSEIIHLMDPSTYEQSELPLAASQDALPFIEDGMEVGVQMVDDAPLCLAVPKMTSLSIAECDESPQHHDKHATLASGLKMKVPGHCKIGDKIIFNCADKRFVSVEGQ